MITSEGESLKRLAHVDTGRHVAFPLQVLLHPEGSRLNA
jgi:hypothetical protein